MDTHQLRIALTGTEPAILQWPQAMTPETLQQLECALASALDTLRHEVRGDTTDPGQVEYASWSQPGRATPH